MKQKMYDCTLRFRGEVIHTLPLERVTKDELRLLAFMHGAESVVELRYKGEGEIEGIKDQMDEYRRLARKYDTIVNSGRGKKWVEECFKTSITDFDSVIDDVAPQDAVAAAAEAAEKEAADLVEAAGKERVETVKQIEAASGGVDIAAGVAGTFAARTRSS